jgi:hypothetical protein
LNYLQALREKFIVDHKHLDVLSLINLANIITKHSKENTSLITYQFLDKLFNSLLRRENANLYFYKCEDIIHVLGLISDIKYIRTYSDFWLKCEDMLMRMKRDFNVQQFL